MAIFSNPFQPDFKTIEELKKQRDVNAIAERILDLRGRVRILVIDDEQFAPLENLKKHGYKVDRIADLDRISDVADYHIVIVDLQGVGKQFNPSSQGAHIIHQVKSNYPEKYVIAYTGGAPADMLVPSIERADKFIQKDVRIDDWCEALDSAVRRLADPVQIWSTMRHRLLDVGITPYQLAQLEDEYVRSLMAHPGELTDRLIKRADKSGVSGDVRAMVVSLIANAIFFFAT